jgi:pyruvate,water dikinase
MAAMAASSIRWFREIGLADRPAVGGKAASLGELERAGIRVPPGFAVTTAAFERHLAALGTETIRRAIAALDPDDLSAVTTASEAIRRRLEAGAMPADVGEAIAQALGELGDAPVAVRSSATSEDAEDASFAGLQDTYLWLRGADAVVDHVRRCWASLYSIASVTYRLKRKFPEERVAMAVVIQRMVNSRSSGVMFTRSPETGDRSVIAIESSWGLGSCIVSGEVTPDRYVVNKVTGDIVRRTVSHKARAHVPQSAGGVREEDVTAERRDLPSVSDDEIKGLWALGRKVEAHYGRAQDIEWAIDHAASGAADILLLQSRPETVWSTREAAAIAAPKKNAFEHLLTTMGGRR